MTRSRGAVRSDKSSSTATSSSSSSRDAERDRRPTTPESDARKQGPLRAMGPAVDLGTAGVARAGPGIQPKLTVSEPGDKYEREAECGADAVMWMSDPESTVDPQEKVPSDRIQRLCPRCRRRYRQGKPLNCEECEQELQRSAEEDRAPTTGGVEQAAAVAREPGKPLSDETQSFFETRMGKDFSDVRIHTGGRADWAARSINARAFTLGNDVVFRSGEYRPGTREGTRLLAHELTHVVQDVQGGSGDDTVRRQSPDEPDAGTSSSDLDAGTGAPSDAGTGPHGGSSRGGAARGPFLDLQIECIIRKGGCPRTRPAGIPGDEEIKSYDTRCRRETGYQGPPVSVSDLECDTPGLGIAKSLERAYPGWKEALPDCPCTLEKAKRSERFTDETSPFTSKFHPGAEADYRSSGTTTAKGTNHGQQCTYDADGALITHGAGAGTPDVWSPKGSFWNHQKIDVEPALELSGPQYRAYWTPNRGTDCPRNEVSGS